MSSLFRRPNSPYWSCAFTGPNGRPLKKSTKQVERKKAWKVCMEFEEAADQAKQGTLIEAHARKIVSQIVEKTTGKPLQFHTAEQWLGHWLKEIKKANAAGTYERYAHVIEEFIEHLASRAQLNIAHVTPQDISGFRDAEQEKGKSAKTCNLAVKTISAAFNAARRQGFIPSNPAEAVRALQHKSETKGTFTPEQVGHLLEAAPSNDWRGAILLAYYTGARLQDVANMCEESIDLPKKTIRFVPQKTRRNEKQVEIPLHPQLEEFLLERASQDDPKAFLFPSLARKKTGGAHGLSQTFKRIMGKMGISDAEARPKKDGKGRAVSRLSFHSLRHTFNSAMANGQVTPEIRQKLTGHASAEMNKGYTHLELEPLRAAVGVIPSLDRPKKLSQ
jgi:integrase